MENIEITKEWDKVFPKSDNVENCPLLHVQDHLVL